MAEQIFTYLSIVIGVVLVSMGIMKILKQPMIIGYIIAGTLISLFLPTLLHETHSIEIFSSIGISFLLFIVWLELNPKIIQDVWKSAITTGVIQVILTSAIGYGLGLLLGFDPIVALYIGIGFAFSSTIVILKLLSDKGGTESVSGRLSMGILIVQDLIVMLLFVAISTIEQLQSWSGIVVGSILLAKIIWLWIALFLISKYILPRATKRIAQSQEHLFLFSIWRCLILGSIFYFLGFSIEIWALVAGITLAGSSYKFEIMSKVKPLRDFFIIMFFVLLGSRIIFPIPTKFILPIIAFTGFILVIKPLIILTILGFSKHSKKNNFLTAGNLGQISEFSFILIMLWISLGHITDPEILSMITIIGLITITTSSYQILYGHKIVEFMKKHPKLYKRIPGKKKTHKHKNEGGHKILLFGYWRFGKELYQTLNKKVEKNILIVDENPEIINELQAEKINCIYGDAGELDFLNELNLSKTKMIISTIKDYDDTILLLKTIKKHNSHIITILISHNTEEAIKLYKEGADYVVLPHFVGAQHTRLLLENYGFDIKKFIEKKITQLATLQKNPKRRITKRIHRGK